MLKNFSQISPSAVFFRQDVSSVLGLAVLSVEDQGGGVPDDELDRIFQPFFRSANGRDDSLQGSGLGLAIASRAIAMNEGTITARNVADGLCVEMRVPTTSG